MPDDQSILDDEQIQRLKAMAPPPKPVKRGRRPRDPSKKIRVLKYRTVEGLQTHPLFMMLTTAQQCFVIEYITHGHKEEAVHRAFPNNKRADIKAIQLLRNQYIRELLSDHYGYSMDRAPLGRQELMGLIANRLRDPGTHNTEFNKLSELFLSLRQKPQKYPRVVPVVEPEEEKEPEEIEPEPEEIPTIDDLVRRIESERKNG